MNFKLALDGLATLKIATSIVGHQLSSEALAVSDDIIDVWATKFIFILIEYSE